MIYDLRVVHDLRFGFYITNIVDTIMFNGFLVNHGSDNWWIKELKIEKDFYLEKMKKLGAYNNATYDWPKMYFKNKQDAERAIVEFFEPIFIMQKLVE